jgi:hypothetical protein
MISARRSGSVPGKDGVCPDAAQIIAANALPTIQPHRFIAAQP